MKNIRKPWVFEGENFAIYEVVHDPPKGAAFEIDGFLDAARRHGEVGVLKPEHNADAPGFRVKISVVEEKQVEQFGGERAL